MDVKQFEIIFQRFETRKGLKGFSLNVGANGYSNQNFLRITIKKLSALQGKQYSSQSVKESLWCLSRAISCGIMRLDSRGADMLVCTRWFYKQICTRSLGANYLVTAQLCWTQDSVIDISAQLTACL